MSDKKRTSPYFLRSSKPECNPSYCYLTRCHVNAIMKDVTRVKGLLQGVSHLTQQLPNIIQHCNILQNTIVLHAQRIRDLQADLETEKAKVNDLRLKLETEKMKEYVESVVNNSLCELTTSFENFDDIAENES